MDWTNFIQVGFRFGLVVGVVSRFLPTGINLGLKLFKP